MHLLALVVTTDSLCKIITVSVPEKFGGGGGGHEPPPPPRPVDPLLNYKCMNADI